MVEPLIHYLPSPASHPLLVALVTLGTTSPPSQNQDPSCVDNLRNGRFLACKIGPILTPFFWSLFPFTQLHLAPSKKPHIHPALLGRGHGSHTHCWHVHIWSQVLRGSVQLECL